MEKEFLEKVCAVLRLGELTEEPKRLSGGFLHRMYSVFTDKGKYAVKLLNPFIMQRETAMENFRTAEHFEAILETARLPVLSALRFNGEKMQVLEGQYFYVFKWFDGKALKPQEITAVHAEKIGRTLAGIHCLERIETVEEPEMLSMDWAAYAQKLETAEPELGRLLRENLRFLEARQAAANSAMKRLSPVKTICHNDMDPKNVLWNGVEHRVIDLECLGYGSPFLELTETALCWAGLDDCRVDIGLFCAFVQAYKTAGGEMPADWDILFDANCGRLGWLEYSIQRALGISCSAEETQMGKTAVRVTLSQLTCTEQVRPALLEALDTI